MPDFLLPDVGEGLTDAEIVTWRVAVGDTVAVNDVLCEIETAKSVVELPSPYAGEVTEILAGEGETVDVGSSIIVIGERSPAAERTPVLVGYGPEVGNASVGRRRRRPRAENGPTESRVQAKPSARKRARELGVDIAAVSSEGPVTVADLEEHLEETVGEKPGEVRIPVRGVRKYTATQMTRSAFSAVHVTLWLTADVTNSVTLLEKLNARVKSGGKVTFTALVARAVCRALEFAPELNATWGEREILQHQYVNLGIAVATPRGLVVPVIRDAHTRNLPQLAGALNAIVEVTRDGRQTPAQTSGGTFTITNIGALGVEGGTPILNPGEAGILAVGALARRPWVVEGDAIEPRWLTTLSLTFDHRVADGEQGARFVTHLAALLTDPPSDLVY